MCGKEVGGLRCRARTEVGQEKEGYTPSLPQHIGQQCCRLYCVYLQFQEIGYRPPRPDMLLERFLDLYSLL